MSGDWAAAAANIGLSEASSHAVRLVPSAQET